jgi:hypothetical protein
LNGLGNLRARRLDEPEERRGVFREMKIGAAKQPGLDVASLRAAIDEPGGLEIVETAIERPHGLQRATGEQLAAREDRSERLGGIDGTREGSEYRASAWRNLFDVRGPKRRPENDPGQVGRVAAKGGEGGRIVRPCFTLASNGKLHD